ncbi:MAG TPA: beta-ketoacyl-ACP synthase II, partial [Longimicrobium sp.]|nr:beta-ketoacyl-ACP synthase II [Longimicrobium sp.]
MSRRVVITGTGMLTAVGLDVPSSWSALLAGTSGVAPITQFDASDFKVRFAAEVKGFAPEEYIDRKEAKRTDRFAQFAIATSVQAMRQAGLDESLGEIDPTRFGVIVGSGIGGIWTFEEQHRKLIESGPRRVSPFFVPMFISDIAAGLVSIRWGLKGPNYCTVSACASSAHAVGNAFRSIKYGEADLMVAGGTEATVSPQTIAGFAAMTALSERNDEPETASRPFDATRDGFVLGEGSGMMVLEELEHARARGATILGEIVGYGQTADAYHITAPAEGGEGAVRAMQAALREAGATPDDVDYVNAHGTSTPANDKNETAAIRTALGQRAYDIIVGSTKSMTGHTLGAAGGIEAVISALVCKEGKIPPTINFHERDPDCD